MNRCGDCKHWAANLERENARYQVDQSGHAMCVLAVFSDDYMTALAYVTAGYGDGLLMTKADFGCVMWEAKEKSQNSKDRNGL